MLTAIRRLWNDLLSPAPAPAPKRPTMIQHNLLHDIATELAAAEADLSRICSDRQSTQEQRNAAAERVELLHAAEELERGR